MGLNGINMKCQQLVDLP